MNTFDKVNDQKSIDIVAKLAHEIWNQHFAPMIGQAKVDYMLEKFQSSDALTKQINEGYEYYIISYNDHRVGYLGLLAQERSGRMMISKIYIKQQARGHGVGVQALEFAKKLSKERNMDTIWLTVHKGNTHTIEWYKKNGFAITDRTKKDIGNGFFMDDYVMELKTD